MRTPPPAAATPGPAPGPSPGSSTDATADATAATRARSQGLALGLAAYGLWGAFPLYFPLLEPGGPVEILAHRVVWSMLTTALLVVLLRRGPQLRAIVADRRTRRLLVVAAAVISVNWAMFIYGVNSGRVVETSLGYFVNPLVTVLIGVLLLGERLRRLQWVAIGVGALAVAVLTWDYGRPPWVALVLAFSFGTYGLAKKKADVGGGGEPRVRDRPGRPTGRRALPGLAGRARPGQAFAAEGVGHALLLMSAGLVTAVPLYLLQRGRHPHPDGAPSACCSTSRRCWQFAIGVLVVGEDMPPGRWIGFALVSPRWPCSPSRASATGATELRRTAHAAAAL